jgi:hypothetical protein
MLWKTVHPIISRKQAKALGLKRYFDGSCCTHGHVFQRLVSNGSCLRCMNERNNKKRRRSGMSRLEAAAERDRAKAEGRTRYNTKRPCKHGHMADRVTSNGACVVCVFQRNDTWKRSNPTKAKAIKKRSNDTHQDRVRTERDRWRLANPEKYAASQRKTAQRLDRRLATRLRVRISNLLRGKPKTGSAVRDLGCTVAELIVHLESQFAPLMTWANYGSEWEIDHIRELASFDLVDTAQFRQAAHYTNLQPLFRADHIEKTRKQLKKAA